MLHFSFFLNNRNGGEIITFKYRYRKQIMIGIIGTIILIGIISSSIYILSKKEIDKKDVVKEDKVLEKNNNNKTENIKEKIKVDIKGQINNPGIYELSNESRVIDVINLAGGLTEEADTSVINLSKKIKDEMVIIIYSKDQVQDFEKTKEIENQVQDKCAKSEEYSINNDACLKTESIIMGKININTATKEELMTLQGIGESKANDIIKHRDTNGKFNSIEDIKKVTGIGENIFASIKENITT